MALASATRYEWVLADLAVMCAGAATTTVYPTTTASDVAFIVANSGSRLSSRDDAQLAKLREHREEIPDVARVVLLDGTVPDDDWVIGSTNSPPSVSVCWQSGPTSSTSGSPASPPTASPH